jgi:hypothetical protein
MVAAEPPEAAVDRHPAFAHVAMGGYTVGAVLAVLGRAGVSEHDLAKGWWLEAATGVSSSTRNSSTCIGVRYVK